jgi:archaellum biogenesis ATPase FlaH
VRIKDLRSILPIAELLAEEYPEQEYLAERLLPAASISILSGQSATYKTWLLLEIALRVAAGEPLFDRFTTAKTGVLIIDEESGKRLLNKRLKMLNADGELPIYCLSYGSFTLDDKNTAYTVAECKKLGIGLVIIDSLTRVHSADENQSNSMSAVMSQLRAYAAAGIAVLLIHHHRKSTQSSGGVSQELRGSSDILAAVDTHLAVRRKSNRLIVTQSKQRYDEELEPFTLDVITDDNGFKFEYIGDSVLPEHEPEVQIGLKVLYLLGKLVEANQKRLLEELKQLGISVNEHSLRQVLDTMVRDKKVVRRSGKANEKLYSLPITRDGDDNGSDAT